MEDFLYSKRLFKPSNVARSLRFYASLLALWAITSGHLFYKWPSSLFKDRSISKKSFLHSCQRRFSLHLLYLVSLSYILPWFCVTICSVLTIVNFFKLILFSNFSMAEKVFSVSRVGTMNIWFNDWNFCQRIPGIFIQYFAQRLLTTTYIHSIISANKYWFLVISAKPSPMRKFSTDCLGQRNSGIFLDCISI